MNVALSKSRPADTQPSAVAGQDRVEQARPDNGGSKMAVISSGALGKKLPLSDEREFAEKFSALILDLNVARLAKATGRSIETVKAWRMGRAFANGASLINAAKAFPAVKSWLLHEIESDGAEGAADDHTLLIMSLSRLSAGDGPAADFARQLLLEMHKPQGRR